MERSAIHTLHGVDLGTANCAMVDGHVEACGYRRLAECCRTTATANKFVKAFISRPFEERFTF